MGFLVDGQTDVSGRHCPDPKKRTLESSLWTLLYKSLHLAGSDLFRSVQSFSNVQLFVTPWTAAH